jgi:hypothetical protein
MGFGEHPPSSVAALASAMSKNPHLRVLVMTGRCDLAVDVASFVGEAAR